jgi:hypothetical protein
VPAAGTVPAATPGATLTSALAEGGGIGIVTPVINSTINANTAATTSTGLGVADTIGGGIDSATTRLVNDTIASNAGTTVGPTGSSVSGGGVGIWTLMANTIIAGNAPTDCGAVNGADSGGNLDTDGTCGLTASRHSVSAGPAHLGPLAHNGGTTLTQALRTGSRAIGLGIAATCEQIAAGPTGVLDTDQRGNARNSAHRGMCDSGAFDAGR